MAVLRDDIDDLAPRNGQAGQIRAALMIFGVQSIAVTAGVSAAHDAGKGGRVDACPGGLLKDEHHGVFLPVGRC